MFRTDYYEKLDIYGQSTITNNTKWFMNLVDQFAHHLNGAMSVNIEALPKNTVLEVIRDINNNKDIYRVPFKVVFIEKEALISKDGYLNNNTSDSHIYQVGENYPYTENKDDNTTWHKIYTKNELDKAINEALSEYKGTPEIRDVLDTLVQVIRKNTQQVLKRDEYDLYAIYNDNLNSFEFCIWTRKLTNEEVELLNNALCIKYLFLKDFGTLIRSKLEWSGEFDD